MGVCSTKENEKVKKDVYQKKLSVSVAKLNLKSVKDFDAASCSPFQETNCQIIHQQEANQTQEPNRSNNGFKEDREKVGSSFVLKEKEEVKEQMLEPEEDIIKNKLQCQRQKFETTIEEMDLERHNHHESMMKRQNEQQRQIEKMIENQKKQEEKIEILLQVLMEQEEIMEGKRQENLNCKLMLDPLFFHPSKRRHSFSLNSNERLGKKKRLHASHVIDEGFDVPSDLPLHSC
mmetsp:Transcript_33617/g.54581  ORF Transcript_33617/g.54581 Transcript_33617/m.54581 type:complete len:233 (+) Transcript_33617:82-780(+)